MSLSLSHKIDELHTCDRHSDTSTALVSIRNQLHELTRSVESCHSEVSEVKRDMVSIRGEIESLQAAKDEIESLRGCVDRLEENVYRRRATTKIRLLQQVRLAIITKAKRLSR